MPFTLVHPLFVAPLYPARRLLPLSALAIGTIVPDWPLFFPIGPNYYQTHNLIGIPLVCGPMGVALFLFYEWRLKAPLFNLLPRVIRQRLVPYRRPLIKASVTFWLGVALAVLIGAASHVFIDSFTHVDRWGTRSLPILNREAFTFFGETMPIFKLLQYGGSAIGLPLLCVLAALFVRHQAPAEELVEQSTRWRVGWLMVLCGATLVGVGVFLFLNDVTTWPSALSAVLRGGICGAGIGFLVFAGANDSQL